MGRRRHRRLRQPNVGSVAPASPGTHLDNPFSLSTAAWPAAAAATAHRWPTLLFSRLRYHNAVSQENEEPPCFKAHYSKTLLSEHKALPCLLILG